MTMMIIMIQTLLIIEYTNPEQDFGIDIFEPYQLWYRSCHHKKTSF